MRCGEGADGELRSDKKGGLLVKNVRLALTWVNLFFALRSLSESAAAKDAGCRTAAKGKADDAVAART